MGNLIGFGFGAEFLEALGVEDKRVTDIHLDIPVDDKVTLTTKRYLQASDAEKIISLFKKYHVVETDDALEVTENRETHIYKKVT